MPANASGTPTTNYGFYTLNTSVDAPNGTGLNLIITSIDTNMKTALDAINVTVAAKPTVGLIIALG